MGSFTDHGSAPNASSGDTIMEKFDCYIGTLHMLLSPSTPTIMHAVLEAGGINVLIYLLLGSDAQTPDGATLQSVICHLGVR